MNSLQTAPEPGVHPAHGGAHAEPEVAHAEAFGEQAILRLDHVPVAVPREPGVEPVARLARPPVPDPVREHDEIARSVEQAAPAIQLARELGPQELLAAPAGAVQDQHGVADDTLAVPPYATERPIVQAEFR
jgi:hypothetical protein